MAIEIATRFSETFDKLLLQKKELQREAAARFIASFDLSSLYDESTRVHDAPDQEVDLSF